MLRASKNLKLEDGNLSKAVWKETETCTQAKIYWKHLKVKRRKKAIYKKRKIHSGRNERFEGRHQKFEVRRGLDQTKSTSGTSKEDRVLTEKTVQESLACFYNCTGRKDITSWLNTSEAGCRSFWSHRWKQRMGQLS